MDQQALDGNGEMDWNSSARFRQDGISERQSRHIELLQRDIEQSIFDYEKSGQGSAGWQARDRAWRGTEGPLENRLEQNY
jgi:hypothetical protein